MISKHKLYNIALVSAVVILMMVNVVVVGSCNPMVKLITNSTTQSVDFLKFPTDECGFKTSGFGFPTNGYEFSTDESDSPT